MNQEKQVANPGSDANEKHFDKISHRIEFIKKLLRKNALMPMVALEGTCETEDVENTRHVQDITKCLPKSSSNFTEIIYQIGGRLKYIKSGTTGHTFKGIIPLDPNDRTKVENYAVKVVAYPNKANYGDPNDVKRPENAELMMLRVLSYFVINGHTPHIVLPIGTFNTRISNFVDLAAKGYVDSKKYDQFVTRCKQGEFHDEVSVLISEWANGGDLLDYMRNNYKSMTTMDWRTLIFQILSTLAIIHTRYPSFRHNDLKANNILVQKIGMGQHKRDNFYMYMINNKGYVVPNIGIQLKIWDFDFACIPGVVDNAKVSADWTSKINIKPEKNQYYDMHYFFNTITRKGFFPELWSSPDISAKVKEFIRRIVPEKFSKGSIVSDHGRILTNEEYLTPLRVIETDPFFECMREGYRKYTNSRDGKMDITTSTIEKKK